MKIIRRPITTEFKISLAWAHSRAKKTGRIMYVCEGSDGLIMDFDHAPDPDGGAIVLAKCWPGGRRELKFVPTNPEELNA